MDETLVQIQIMHFTEDPRSGNHHGQKHGAYNLHPKHLKKIGRLEFKQPFPVHLTHELELFPKLTELRFEKGFSGEPDLALLATCTPNLDRLSVAKTERFTGDIERHFPELTMFERSLEESEFVLKHAKLTSLILEVPRRIGQVDLRACTSLENLDIRLQSPVSEVLLPNQIGCVRVYGEAKIKCLSGPSRVERLALHVLCDQVRGDVDVQEFSVVNTPLSRDTIRLLKERPEIWLDKTGFDSLGWLDKFPETDSLILGFAPPPQKVRNKFPNLKKLSLSNVTESVAGGYAELFKGLRFFGLDTVGGTPKESIESLSAAMPGTEIRATIPGGGFSTDVYENGRWETRIDK